MNTITNNLNTGKQDVQLPAWYRASSPDKIVSIRSSKSTYDTAPTLASQYKLNGTDLIPSLLAKSVVVSQELTSEEPTQPLPQIPLQAEPLCHEQEHAHNVIPLVDRLERSPPSEPSLINLQEISVDVSPLADRVRSAEPREPSRIWKVVSEPTHGLKHRHAPSSSTFAEGSSTPLSLPMKRQKTSSFEGPVSDLPSSSISKSSFDSAEYYSYNTLAGTDLVDFWFSSRVPAEIIALEETERTARINKGIDAILSGKFSLVQKELMIHLHPINTLSEKGAEATSTLRNSLSNLAEDITKKSKDLYEATIGSLQDNSLQKSLNTIIEQSEIKPINFDRGVSEDVVFSWPRKVPAQVLEAEELARLERIQRGADPIISGKLTRVHAQLRSKWIAKTPSVIVAKNILGAKIEVVGAALNKATAVIEEVVHETASALNKLTLNVENTVADTLHFREKDLSLLEEIRRAEELERCRRINQSEVDPLFDARKRAMEKELLSSSAIVNLGRDYVHSIHF